MRSAKGFIILCWIIFLVCSADVHAQWRMGNLKRLGGNATSHLETAVTRLAHQARHQVPRPIYLRTLPVTTHLTESPVFPLVSHPKEIYRGLALDAQGKELQAILAKGMKLTDSHFTPRRGAYDNRAYGDEAKALFATTDPLLASTYAQMNRFRPNEDPFLPVVLHLKRIGEDAAPEQPRRTIEITQDIPASWICKVSVLLEIDEKLRWGELISLGEDGFIFTPYSTSGEPVKPQP